MATAPQLAVNRANSLASTGPRTEQGKAQSAQNAVTSGLFTQRDFVRPAEQAEYTQLRSTFETELNPQGTLEATFVAAIVGATWRLRRCSQVEAGMAEKFTADPMEDDAGGRTQRSVDRARAQAFNILRRSTADLRRLQTDRAISIEMFHNSGQSPDPGLIGYRNVNRALHELDRSRLLVKKLHRLDSLAGILNQPLPSAPPASSPSSENSAPLASFCKPAASALKPAPIGRNTPCPCSSGAKYKRCCGKNAAALLHKPLAHAA